MSILQSTKFTVAMLIGICTGAASLGYAEEAPSGADWWNSRTRDKNTTLSVGLKSLVVFRVGKDKAVDRWQWYVDGVDQKVNNRAFTWRAGPRAKTYAIKVSGGGKGVTWKVRVLQGTGDIAGAVVDADNKPIKGAVITAGKRSATTDGRGRYAFRKLPEDGHVLTAHKDGYVWQTKHVKVTSGKTTTEKFQLPRFQPAKITYNGKMISIANGTATLTTINRAVNDRAALEKISPKVWLLKRTITLDSKATLYVNDSDTKELRLLSMKDGNEANIKGNGRLEFLNVTVTSWDTTGKGPARVYLKRAYISSRYPILKYPTGGGGWLFNSVFKCLGALQGGQNGGIYIAPPSGYKEPVYIVNSRFFDCCPRNYFDTPKKKSAGIYRVGNRITTLRGGGKLYSGGGKASQSFSDVPNNIISHNVTDSWMGVNRVGNLIFEGNTITWSLHNAFAINGTSTSGPNPVNSIALETEVTGCDHNGMQMSGACRNCIFKNCVVHSADTAKYGTRVNDNGYYLTWDGKTDSTRPRDGLLEDCIAYDVRARGLAFDGVSNYTIRRYAAWNNGLWGGPRKDVVDIDFYRSNNNYVIDSDIERRLRNCDNSFGNSMINTRYGELYVTHGDVTVYYYLDVLVQDRKGKPISGAKVTVVNEVDAARTPINLHTKTISTRKMKGELLKPRAIKETRTGHDGHTPLPSDGENTLVIAEHLNKKIGWPPVITHYTYTIRAEKGGVSAKVTGIKPDKTWYRPKPDIPIKTIKITLRR